MTVGLISHLSVYGTREGFQRVFLSGAVLYVLVFHFVSFFSLAR